MSAETKSGLAGEPSGLPRHEHVKETRNAGQAGGSSRGAGAPPRMGPDAPRLRGERSEDFCGAKVSASLSGEPSGLPRHEHVKEEKTLPRHIAVIMDGNGRWAKKRGLPRTAGHSAGADAFRKIARYSHKLGVQYLTVYAFSTENWKRPADEVAGIMALLEKYLLQALRDLEKEKIRICIFGDLAPFTPRLQTLCRECMERSSIYTGGQVNICLNYGGRDEIVRAAQKWAAEGCPALSEERFGSYMWGGSIPDPDLLIRPGGEMRISNFLLWECAYSEFYFTDVLWPDFDEAELDKAIEAFRHRQRRYGDVG